MKPGDDKFSRLRQKAEAAMQRLQAQTDGGGVDLQSAIHELAVHQIELELQNEELQQAQRRSEEARDSYARLYNLSPVGYLILDEQGLISRHNHTFALMTGAPEHGVTGRPLADFMDGGSREIFLGRYRPFFKNPQDKSIDVKLVSASGTALWVKLVGRRESAAPPIPQQEAGREHLLVTLTDITELKLMDETVRLNGSRFESLLKLSQMVVSAEREIIDFALEEAIRLTNSTGGYLHFFNEDEQTIQLNSWSKDVLKTCKASSEHHYPLASAGVWADSARLRRPVVHNDYQQLPGRKGYPSGHFTLLRHLGVPIFDAERIVGVTGVGNKTEPYHEDDVLQVQLFMNSMWAILKRQRMNHERERMIRELEEALAKVKLLAGMLPICASCKKIRNDEGYWQQIEVYIGTHSEAEFSHGICPECAWKLYPEYAGKIFGKDTGLPPLKP